MFLIFPARDSNQSGPDQGWNLTTLYNQSIKVEFQAVYFREFGLAQPKPQQLTYLLFNASNNLILTHYITSAPDFDDIVLVDSIDENVNIPSNWPLVVTFDHFPDKQNVLKEHTKFQAHLQAQYASGSFEKQELLKPISLNLGRRIYTGVDDGFADFGRNCEIPPPHPQHRSLCGGYNNGNRK